MFITPITIGGSIQNKQTAKPTASKALSAKISNLFINDDAEETDQLASSEMEEAKQEELSYEEKKAFDDLEAVAAADAEVMQAEGRTLGILLNIRV